MTLLSALLFTQGILVHAQEIRAIHELPRRSDAGGCSNGRREVVWYVFSLTPTLTNQLFFTSVVLLACMEPGLRSALDRTLALLIRISTTKAHLRTSRISQLRRDERQCGLRASSHDCHRIKPEGEQETYKEAEETYYTGQRNPTSRLGA